MPYSIIPPILVVLSVIGIILVLMKKAPEIGRLDISGKKDGWTGIRGADNDIGVPVTDRAGKTSFLKKIFGFVFSIISKIVKIFPYSFSVIRRIFAAWKESARNKESARRAKEEKISEERAEAVEVIQKDKERVVRPFISEKMVKPTIDEKRKKEIKERLEELLIERIASNPKDIEAYERLGEYYMEIGNLEHSKECFKQVIRLDSGNRSIRYKIRKLERMLKG